MIQDTDHRKRLIIELIKIKVNTGQPLDKILTKLTRDRYKHWNWEELVFHIKTHHFRQALNMAPDYMQEEEKKQFAEETANFILTEIKQDL